MSVDVDDDDYLVDRNIYRVEFMEDGSVQVLNFDYTQVDPELYACTIETLPEWMQKRLAVLMVMEYEPPTKIVRGIGRRIDKNVFWVLKPDDEEKPDE